MTEPVNLLEINTPLGTSGGGLFEIVSLSGSETLSAPFSYTAILRSGGGLLDQTKLLYQPVTVTIASGNPHQRFVSGLVESVTQEPANSAKLWDYRLVIVPKFAFLQQTQDCRFFENLSALDIVKKILAEAGITDLDIRVSDPPPTRPYTVMFNESYRGFIERLLASAGIFYFFEFSETAHTLILGDSNTAFKTIGTSPIAFGSQGGILSGIDFWHRIDVTSIGRTDRGDYNPETSKASITGSESTVLTDAGAKARAHYQWPVFASDKNQAGAAAKRHMQAAEARAQLYQGGGSVPDLYAGGKFTLETDPITGSSTDYILQTMSMIVEDAGRGASHGGANGVTVSCTAFPAATPWQPAPLAKPLMAGIYTATVIGPDGQDIHTDKLASIKVKFPWDHRGETTESGALWVRVIQPWSGGGWGAQFIPRVGMEVAISFIEGDIDRPVAIGTLYNSANTPIFPEAKKNISGFRTRSTLQGGTADYSELSFDDTKGSEIFLVHAQKDYTIEVENDQTLTVDHNRAVTVKNNETAEIKNDQTLTVDHNRAVTVKNNETVDITGSQTVTAQQAISHASKQSITLKVGSSSIKIDNEGITLTALKITLTGNASIEAGAPMTKVTGDGMLTLKGGLVQVN